MPGKILVVDDDPDTVHILELVFKDRGYERFNKQYTGDNADRKGHGRGGRFYQEKIR